MAGLRIRTYIILSCLTTVYLAVEGLNVIINDPSHSNFDRHADAVIHQLLKKVKYEPKQNEIKTISKLLEKINDNALGKTGLRGNAIGSVQDFLHKLNNFNIKNTQNYNYKKRDGCHFGFGSLGSCKKTKFRRNVDIQRKERDKVNYAQHMFVERARYRTSSENSDDDSWKQKSRFQIVDNAKYKRNKRVSSEEQDDGTLQIEMTDDSEEQPSKEREEIIIDNDSGSDEPRKEISDDSDETSVEKKDTDERYMYLQGTRLQKPRLRGTVKSKGYRRNSRLPYFMPKRYKWDDNMLTHLDEYWNVGIKAYDTYRPKYQLWLPYSFK